MKEQIKKKYYTSTCGPSNGNWITSLGYEHTNDIVEADVVIFGGGADIEPATYGDEPARWTGCSPEREKREREDFYIAQELKTPSVGICRGIQLLCALSGGKLIQDVTNHAGSYHGVKTFDDMVIETNSIHHQMINPYVLNSNKYRILAWSSKKISDHYIGHKNRTVYLPYNFKEIEACYFRNTNSLGFQYHPEMMWHKGTRDKAILWTQKIFQQFIDKKL